MGLIVNSYRNHTDMKHRWQTLRGTESRASAEFSSQRHAMERAPQNFCCQMLLDPKIFVLDAFCGIKNLILAGAFPGPPLVGLHCSPIRYGRWGGVLAAPCPRTPPRLGPSGLEHWPLGFAAPCLLPSSLLITFCRLAYESMTRNSMARLLKLYTLLVTSQFALGSTAIQPRGWQLMPTTKVKA